MTKGGAGEEVGEGRRHVHDDRRAEQEDRIEHPVVPVDRVPRNAVANISAPRPMAYGDICGG